MFPGCRMDISTEGQSFKPAKTEVSVEWITLATQARDGPLWLKVAQ